jgi:hypothetical protein
MGRPALGSLRLLWLLGLRLHRLWVPVLRLRAVELARVARGRLWLKRGWINRLWLSRGRLGPLRLLLRLRLDVLRCCFRLILRHLRCLRLLILLRRLLTRCSTTLSLSQSRKLTRKNRLFIAWRNLLAIKRNVELDARLTTSILRVLAGIESSQ